MKRLIGNPVIIITLLILVNSFTGCKKSETNSTTYAVKLATSPTLGQYMVDKDGYALYFFSTDYKGRNSCSGGCAAVWPYFYAGTLTQEMLGTGLALSDFDTIIVSGTNQTRYKGWPLYYYAPNGTSKEAPGLTSGEGINDVWFVAKPDYSIMLAKAQLVDNDGNNYTSTYTQGRHNTLLYRSMGINFIYF
jgi:predicted lipoprotein with Yx(FWY)xxD motif